VDDPLLVGVLDAQADLGEQAQASLVRELPSVAVLRQRFPRHVLHREERKPTRRLSGVEHLGDRGMIHEGERLTLGLEAGDHPLRVHPELHDLDRHTADDRALLLGQEHRAEASLADLLHQPVGADVRARTLGVHRRDRARDGRPVPRGQERLDLGAQALVSRAFAVEHGGTLRLRKRHDLLEDLLGPIGHGVRPLRRP
jgi:hypothetical protein